MMRRHSMKIKIELLSDLCAYSGETYNSMVDTDVVYDEYGLPYIPAKRLKGCIREAALELCELGAFTKEEYTSLFGTGGSQDNRSRFTISNAYLEKYDDTIECLKQIKNDKKCFGLASQQNVLNLYTYVRTQTAVDLDKGSAIENSLRAMRVVNKGRKFEAELSTDLRGEDNLYKYLENSLKWVKHIGVSRTRGLGLVNLTLDKSSDNNTVKIDKSKLTENNKIRYSVDLKSSVICKSAQGNQVETEDFIAGSKVLGLIAGNMGKEKYKELMCSNAKLIVSNGYISSGDNRGLPGRASLQKEKDKKQPDIYDMLYYEPGEEAKQLTPAGISYMFPEGDKYKKLSVKTEISYHHQRPEDKSIGKATGEDGSSFYQLSSISTGQRFIGYIYADKKAAEAVIDALEKDKNIRIGYGKGTGFGAVDFEIKLEEPKKTAENFFDEAVITLVSDVILYNENGMLTADINDLKDCLADILGISKNKLSVDKPFLKYAKIGGYNVTWGKRKPIFSALGKGSTFILKSDEKFDISKLDGNFIGERINEGFGELKAQKSSGEKIIKVYEAEDSFIYDNKFKGSEIFGSLLNAEFKRRIQMNINEINFDDTKNRPGLNAAVAKIRLIFKDKGVNNYVDMKEQVDGIEGKEKVNLCQKLIIKVNPDDLKKSIDEDMINDYGKTVNDKTWNDNELFKTVYNYYIAELKYLAKQQNSQKVKKEGKNI